jgi:hypothetical protein
MKRNSETHAESAAIVGGQELLAFNSSHCQLVRELYGV